MRESFTKKLVSVNKFLFLFLATEFILSSFPVNSNGQDTQYWTDQYGTYGELLGGTIIGSASDLSATFYNPGALAFSTDGAYAYAGGFAADGKCIHILGKQRGVQAATIIEGLDHLGAAPGFGGPSSATDWTCRRYWNIMA